MRRWAYILTLLAIWAASMGALVLGLDGLFGAPGGSVLCGWFIFGGAQTAAFATVSLAEEVAEFGWQPIRQAGGKNPRRNQCQTFAAGKSYRVTKPQLSSMGRLGASKERRISEHAA